MTLAHEPAQLVRPVWQLSAHLPLEQTFPAGQALPHAPQFPSSVARSTHVPLQSVRPA